MTKLLDEYLSDTNTTPMEAGLVRKILTRKQGFSGTVMPRYEYAEARARQGNVRIDDEKKRYWNTDTGSFYAFRDITTALVNYTEWLMKRKDAL